MALAGLAILHGSIAALFVDALLRLWRVQEPDLRLGLRLLALIVPFFSPAYALLAGWLQPHQTFAEWWVLFDGASWDRLALGPVRGSAAATAALSTVGLVLFARDTVPFLTDRFRHAQDEPRLDSNHAAVDALARVVESLPHTPDRRLPRLVVLDSPDAILYCSGVDHVTLTASTGTLARLDADALRAAVAHELEHAHRRDPAFGWLLIVVRFLQAFNPATQITGRQVVEEIERRADHAVATAGLGRDLARAIERLSLAESAAHTDLAGDGAPRPMGAVLVERAVRRATSERCARLTTVPHQRTTSVALPLAAATLCLLLLLVLVV